MNTTELFDLAQLAEAAYGNFVDADGDLITLDDARGDKGQYRILCI